MAIYHGSAVLRNDGTDSITNKKDLNAGVSIPVKVEKYSDNTDATLYDINDNPIANPVTTDSKGNFVFKAADDEYNIYFNKGTADEVKQERVQVYSLDSVIVSPSEVVLSFDTLADALASTKLAAGDSINLKERTTGNGGGGMWDVVLASSVTVDGVNIIACTVNPVLALVTRVRFTQVKIGDSADTGTEDGVVCVGYKAAAVAPGSVSIGDNAVGEYHSTQEPIIGIAQTITIGWNAKSSGSRGTAIGVHAEAKQHASAYGRYAKALGYRSVAIGDSAEVLEVSPVTGSNTGDTVAIGYSATVEANSGIAIGAIGVNGEKTNASQPNCIAIGQGANIKERAHGVSDDSIVIGNMAKTSGSVAAPSTVAAVVLGFEAAVESFNCVAIGRQAEVINSQSSWSVAIGNRAKAKGEAGVAIGNYCETQQSNGVAIGDKCVAQDNAVAIGDTSLADPSAVAVGHEATATDTNAVAIGRLATASHFASVALGERSITTRDNQVNLSDRHVEMNNVTTQPTPATGSARFYFRDNGGTQEMVVIFANGTTKILANDL